MNHCSTQSELERALSIPINDQNWEKPTWCRVTLTLNIDEGVNKSLQGIWREIVKMIHNVVGYVRSGSYTSVNYSPIMVKTVVELFERVDLIEYKSLIQQRLGVKCSMVMDSFSFDN